MTSLVNRSTSPYYVDESLLSTVAAEIQALSQVRVWAFGSRARAAQRPSSDLELLITVPDAIRVYSTSRIEGRRQAHGNGFATAFSHDDAVNPTRSRSIPRRPTGVQQRSYHRQKSGHCVQAADECAAVELA
jgi:hypothetical protein